MNLPASLFEHTLWEEDKNPIWLGSSLTLSRNLTRFKFPTKLSEAELKNTSATVTESLPKNTVLKSPLYLAAEKLSPLDKEFLYEHFLCLESFQNAGKGQGFILDGTDHFLAKINLENHLQLQLIDTSADLLSAWARLEKIETEIGKSVEYAFSPKFGYLTSDPTQCGTALQALLYLHLPALHHTGQLFDVIRDQKEEGIITMGLEGSLDDLIGDFLILRNKYTLGVTEEGILHSLQILAIKLMTAERKLRSNLQDNAEIKDLVSRAYGLLVHSYQLQIKEALNALSAIKLGLDLGFIGGISPQTVSSLFFKCRHAHLAHLLSEKTLEIQDLPHKRAEFIHKALQGMTLKE